MAVQTFAPVEFVANTGLPMWSARTKLTTPPSITAMGSQPFQTSSRISAPEVSLYSAIRRQYNQDTNDVAMRHAVCPSTAAMLELGRF